MVTRLMSSAAIRSTCRPTATDPVSETLRITGDRINRSTIGTAGPVRIDSVPAGKPASISA